MAISLSNAISKKREPKRGNRWILKFEKVPYHTLSSQASSFSNGASDAAESLAIDLVSASRPSLSVGTSEVSRLNEKWKFATAPTWEPIQMSYYDFDSGKSSATQILWRWMQTIYDVLNGTMGYAATYKVDASLVLLGPGQTSSGGAATTSIEIIEAWDLFGCWPTRMTTGSLSYESSEILKVDIELAFDYANLHTLSDYGGEGGRWSNIS